MWSKLKPSERTLLIIVIVLLAFGLGYYGGFKPIQGKLASLDDDIFAMQMQLRKAKIFVRQHDSVMEEAKKFPNLEGMNARKDEEENAALLSFIEEEARKAHVTLSDVKPQTATGDRITKRYTVELSIESGMKELMEFIYHLQFSPQMLKVEKVETAPKEEGSAVLRSNLVMQRIVVK